MYTCEQARSTRKHASKIGASDPALTTNALAADLDFVSNSDARRQCSNHSSHVKNGAVREGPEAGLLRRPRPPPAIFPADPLPATAAAVVRLLFVPAPAPPPLRRRWRRLRRLFLLLLLPKLLPAAAEYCGGRSLLSLSGCSSSTPCAVAE